MATIVYLHGFASAGESPKSDAIRDLLPEHVVISPNLPVDPDQVIAIVNDIVLKATSYPVVFVGTSLGGFWANYFAHTFDAPCVLVNPCTNPHETLAKYVGKTVTNYATQELINVTDENLARFAELENAVAGVMTGNLVNLFVAQDDDVISAQQVLEYFKFTNHTTVTEDGGHRYEKYWDRVVECVKDIVDQQVN